MAPNVAHPGRWGAFDDAYGELALPGVIQVVSDPDDPSNLGVWKIPALTSPNSGMAVLDGTSKAGWPSPTAGYLQWTVDVRYRINSTPSQLDGSTIQLPNELVGLFEAYPFMIDVSSGTTPGIKYMDGYRSADRVVNTSGFSYFQTQSNEVTQSVYQHPEPSVAPQSARDAWHLLRITQSFTNLTASTGSLEQRVYLNGTLLSEYIRPSTRPLGHRSIWIRQGTSGENAMGGWNWSAEEMGFQETMIDYIRVAEGIVPIGEALNAPGAVTYAESDFNQDGKVDGADLNAWSGNFGLLSGASKAQGDANGDGKVTGADLLMWQRQRGSGGATTAVPEPTAWSAAWLATALAAAYRRRRG